MTKEQQNLAWACSPREVRDEIKRAYKNNCKQYNEFRTELHKGGMNTLEYIYGVHNLTSDTEPKEMLMVERKTVQEYKAEMDYNLARNCKSEYLKGSYRGQQMALEILFGDKCLPDKEEPLLKIDAADSLIAIAKDEMGISDEQPSVQVEPKFKVGDKVRVISGDHLGEIAMVTKVVYDGFCKLSNIDGFFPPIRLEHYTEPETKDMEAKELNLCELLKGCEEEEFYCSYLRNNVKFIGFDEHDGMTFILSLYKDGLGYENLMYIKKNDKIGKSFVLYPSRSLYEKYPLDAYSAWMEWKEARKPKYEVRCIIEYWEVGTSSKYTAPYNIIVSSKEEAQQAAEAVRECLQKFHEKNSEK